MATSNVYTLGPVVTAAGQINQIQSYDIDPGILTMVHCGDGQVDYQHAAVLAQEPRMAFATTAIARALGIAGISGYAVAAAADFYFQKVAAGGTRTGGATSLKLTTSKGILIPTSLEADNDNYARLGMELIALSTDGAAAALTPAADQTMPAITATDQGFVVGPIAINGTVMEGVESLSVNFGLGLVVKRDGGEVYPTFAGILKRKPSLTFRTTNVGLMASLGQAVAQGITDSTFYLRKVSKNGDRVALITAEHVKISLDDGLLTSRPVGTNEENEQVIEYLFEPTWDGTNDVMAISTASAIT